MSKLLSIKFHLMLAKRHARASILYQRRIKDLLEMAGAEKETIDGMGKYIHLYVNDMDDVIKDPANDIKQTYIEARINKKARKLRKKIKKQEEKLNNK